MSVLEITDAIFLRGKKTNLRPLDKERDLKSFLVWMNDQEILQYLSRFAPVTRIQEEKWFMTELIDNFVLAIETKDGALIGDVGLHRIDYRNGTSEIGIMIGNNNYWNQGYGFDAEMNMLNFAFNTLNLRKITHRAFSFNQRSVGLAQKCGGIKEGILRREIFKNGKYHSLVIFAIFKNRWQKIWKEYYQN